MRDLAILADKYIIEALSNDLQVPTFVKWLNSKYYTERFISRKETPTFDLWMFAARYSMHDLEGYCRADSSVFAEIRSVIANSNKGIQYFMREAEIPLSVINKVVTAMALQKSNSNDVGKHCQRCYRTTASRCSGCGQIY